MKSDSASCSNWSAKPGVWFSIVAIISMMWNVVGAVQFINSITASEAGMKAAMMTPEQIKVLTSLPSWVTFIFGVGVVTSLIGSVLLYLRHRGAQPDNAANKRQLGFADRRIKPQWRLTPLTGPGR